MKIDMREVAEISSGLVVSAIQNPVMLQAIIFAAPSLYAAQALENKGQEHEALERSLREFQGQTRSVFLRMKTLGSDPLAYAHPTRKL